MRQRIFIGSGNSCRPWWWERHERDASIKLGYQWSEGFSTTLGYRYLDVDYEKNDFLYDVAQDGLTLGFSWRF